MFGKANHDQKLPPTCDFPKFSLSLSDIEKYIEFVPQVEMHSHLFYFFLFFPPLPTPSFQIHFSFSFFTDSQPTSSAFPLSGQTLLALYRVSQGYFWQYLMSLTLVIFTIPPKKTFLNQKFENIFCNMSSLRKV